MHNQDSPMSKHNQTWLNRFNRYSSFFDFIFVCLIVLVVSVMGSVWYGYQTNARAIQSLTEDLITQVSSTITQKTTHYLIPATVMSELGARITGDQVDNLVNNRELDDLMIEVLKLHSQLFIFSIANRDGNFLMHSKQSDGGILTRSIDLSSTEPASLWTKRDSDGQVVSTESRSYDGFDVTKRPWFIGASESRKSYWSDVYIFHTSQQPGITSSFPIIRNNEVVGVFGLDILLTELSEFVSAQNIGANGKTFLINANGHLIAGEDSLPVVEEGQRARLLHVSEHSNPALAKAWDDAVAQGKRRVNVTVDGTRWIGAFLPLEGQFSAHGWTVGLLVPEDDIIGPVKKSNMIQLFVSLTMLVIAILVGFGLRRIKTFMDIQSRFIRRTFGRYLSDEIVTEILRSPEGLKLGGQKRTITLMMTDLRGFTALSERHAPEEVVTMLNDYFGEMTDIIMKWGGTIDEFIGDAILVMFGAPYEAEDDAQRAVACALEMQLAMAKVNQLNKEKGLPDLEMGIGINTGCVIVGNIGSEKRTKYSVIGQHVNLVARVESYTVGGQILITEATREACAVNLVIRDKMELRPKGIAGKVMAYDVTGIKGQHQISLPERARAEMQSLAKPIDVVYSVLEGKGAGEESKSARIISVSVDRYINITFDEAQLSVHDNLKVRLSLDGRSGDCYAKVLEVLSGAQGLALLGITSIPPELENLLHKQISKTNG